MGLIDSYNRKIDYLRISVTDRCNFRCVYCMPEAGAQVSPKQEILTFEEIERLVRIAVELGITKIRLTGGEPLVRRDIGKLVKAIGSIPGLKDLSLTTNGFLLAGLAREFVVGGLHRVNISLDTLQASRFQSLARRGNLKSVLEGIDAALNVGLKPVKLNCVVMRGYNDDEVVDFARLSYEQPFDVRFIELMPINWSRGDDSSSDLQSFFALSASSNYEPDRHIKLYSNEENASFHTLFRIQESSSGSDMLDAMQMRRAFVSTAEIRQRIEADLGRLTPADTIGNGPAHTYRLDGANGTVGFISQITNDMCRQCNRLRLTADGQLRPCLMADGEVDLRSALRAGAEDEEIAELFRLTVFHKPLEHRLEDGKAPIGRSMSRLGG